MPKSSSGRKLLEVAEDLVFHADEIESLKQALLDRRGSRFGVPDLDRERVTRREGDTRVVAG